MEKPQTGLLSRAKSALKSWTVDDLDGFSRPADMPMDTYRKLRRLKNLEFERRAMPVRIWTSKASGEQYKRTRETGNPAYIAHGKGTYRRAIHGQIGSRHQTI